METVYAYKEERWAWKCPNCKEMNDVYDSKESIVVCESCDKEFKPKFED